MIHVSKKYCFVFVCLAAVVSNILYAQKEKIRFEKISIEQGLSQSSVVRICQDKKGFLWIGTFEGLNRYDGFQFKVYKNNPTDSTSLIQNTVRSIIVDHLGILWVGTERGLSRYNSDKDNFTNYLSEPGNSNSLPNNYIRRIYEDMNNNIWITTEGGLSRYNSKNDSFVNYTHDPQNRFSIVDNSVRTVYEDKQNNFWVGTEKGLDLMDRNTGKFTHYKNDPADPSSLSENFVIAILEDKEGMLWIGTRNGGLNRFDRKNKKFIRYKYDPNNPYSLRYNTVTSILEDSSGDLWFATYGGGLEKYDRENDRFIHFQKEFYDPHSISGNAVHCIFEDRSGIIWLGVDFGGLNKLDKRKNQFIYYGNNPIDPNGLKTSNINVFYEDPADNGKKIWIGTWGEGFALFDRVNDKFTFYKNNPADANSLSNNIVRCILKDKNGMLWIGTDGGLNKFNPRTRTFKRYFYNSNDPGSLRNNLLKVIHEDRDGDIWIATNGGGLELYDKKNDKFIHHLPDSKNPNSLNDNIVWFIHEDKEGIFWLGTNAGGLNRFDKSTGSFTHFMKDPNNPKSISENKVLTIFEDGKNNLWLGTAGGGLNKFNKATMEFEKFTVENGLPSNTVHAIVGDNDNNLWISSTRGISKFNLVTSEVNNFSARDGLQSDEFHVNSFCKSITGELFFGGFNGFNIFKPEKIKRSEFIPQIVFTDFRLFNKPVQIGGLIGGRIILEKSITETKKIILSHKDEIFSIQFAVMDFSSPEKNMYAYKMEGFDNEWNYVGNRFFATYTKLPPGEYIFHVKGSNHNGVWNEAGISIAILIEPPFWETWIFRLSTAVVLIGLSVAGYKFRTSRIRALSRELEQRVKERTDKLENTYKELEDFSYSVSHDLRAPLRAIDGYSNIFLDEYGSTVDDEGKRLLNVISSNSKKMGILIDDLLALSRIGRHELNKQTIDMENKVISICNELSENIDKSKYEIQIEHLPNITGDKSLDKFGLT